MGAASNISSKINDPLSQVSAAMGAEIYDIEDLGIRGGGEGEGGGSDTLDYIIRDTSTQISISPTPNPNPMIGVDVDSELIHRRP
jgi:hypothetical protein